ncbi:MAG TPA: hypothetical protein VGM25_12485 [Caulobacteraceae bacterium]
MRLLRSSLLMLAVSAAAAHAETPAPTPDPAPVPSVQRAAKPISDTDLQDLSGGQAAAVNDQQLKAVTSDNSVNALGNITNGPVTLNAGAFSGFSGLGNFVVNTGNNNTLQGSMSVTIVMTPAP